jgi:Zn-dependent protease with chaperone function
MRFPFDLIAAYLFLDGIARCLSPEGKIIPRVVPLSLSLAGGASLVLLSWLMHELAARDAEWRTRFGLLPSGFGRGPHPLIVHTWAVCIAQALSVLFYAGWLWVSQWTVWMAHWPAALGLNSKTQIGGLALANSTLVTGALDLLPFLACMAVGWIPRRRLAARMRGRAIPLLSYLSYEARLTWLPLAISVLLAIIVDLSRMLPGKYTEWFNRPWADLLTAVVFIVFTSLILLPKLIIWLWKCKPLPEGQLKDRLMALLRRSGVAAREIMVWGPRSSGLLNACVLGGWARFRYVLISPALVDELGTDETEAVLAHELGHARYGHLAFLLMMVLCLSAVLDPVLDILPENWRNSPLAYAGVLISVVGAYMYFFYGTVMRQCEREADLASAELMGTPAPLIAALEKLAVLTGNVRHIWCWHHGSIAERVAAVQQLSGDPEAGRRFHARQRMVRILFALLTFAALGAELWSRLV